MIPTAGDDIIDRAPAIGLCKIDKKTSLCVVAPFLRRNSWVLYQKMSDEPINRFDDGVDATLWGNRSHWLRRLPFLSSGRADPRTIPCGGEGTRDGRCNHWGGHEEGGKKDANVLSCSHPGIR